MAHPCHKSEINCCSTFEGVENSLKHDLRHMLDCQESLEGQKAELLQQLADLKEEEALQRSDIKAKHQAAKSELEELRRVYKQECARVRSTIQGQTDSYRAAAETNLAATAQTEKKLHRNTHKRNKLAENIIAMEKRIARAKQIYAEYRANSMRLADDYSKYLKLVHCHPDKTCQDVEAEAEEESVLSESEEESKEETVEQDKHFERKKTKTKKTRAVHVRHLRNHHGHHHSSMHSDSSADCWFGDL